MDRCSLSSMQLLACPHIRPRDAASEGATLATSSTTSSIQLCVLVHRCVNSTVPRYMTDLTVSVGSTPLTARRRLRSSSSVDLVSFTRRSISATESSSSLVHEPGTVYRLVFARPRHHTIPSKDICNHSCLDNIFVCANVHTDYVCAVVAVCTAYPTLQIVN